MRGLIMVVALTGCMKPAAFTCTEDQQCVRAGEQGTCEPIGSCSFSDPSCSTGRRYGDLGEQGGQCVGADPGADASDMPSDPQQQVPSETPDAPLAEPDAPAPEPDAATPDAPTVCPGFTLTDGHYYKLLSAAGWTNQRSACGMIPGNVFLAVPDDAAELTALVTFAGGDAWIGISDAATEGNYMTVQGATATFLPWAAGEPDNAGNQDCVRTKGASSIETALCGTATIAVCECLP